MYNINSFVVLKRPGNLGAVTREAMFLSVLRPPNYIQSKDLSFLEHLFVSFVSNPRIIKHTRISSNRAKIKSLRAYLIRHPIRNPVWIVGLAPLLFDRPEDCWNIWFHGKVTVNYFTFILFLLQSFQHLKIKMRD